MKRLSGIWSQIIDFENLFCAWRKAQRGKKHSPEVSRFALNMEAELIDLQRDLKNGHYTPGEYRLFTIYERKARQIAAAPLRDRIVHHAIMNLLEPPLDRAFIYDSYACRKGKGVHRAVRRYQHWARRYAYALKMDVAQYFPSIDHQKLKEKLRQRIKERPVIKLLDTIIDTSPHYRHSPVYFKGDDLLTPLERQIGIPIGNLTSQFFANLYLDDLDHTIKQQLGVRAYLRYVDDMVVLDNSKSRLAEIRLAVREHLASDRLLLHPRKAHVHQTQRGLDLLGYLVFPTRRRLRNDNGFRFARKLQRYAKGYSEGRLVWSDFNPAVQSWIGHACHADTGGLRKHLFGRTIFCRGSGREATSA
ncbi:MAG: reverse transcriptase/maturase family protein [Candidatus Thiodiazotropha taylori]|nr:reverse transcriptase/maturase family protein [Candidatus Thiodiazotropha taylori]